MAIVTQDITLADRSAGFTPQDLLGEHAKRGKLRSSDLARVLTAGNFPPGTKAVLPGRGVSADWRKDGWVCMHEYAFRIGHVMPFSPLVRSFLITFGFAPSQIMPTAWRILLQFEKIGVEHAIPVALADVMLHYNVYLGGGNRVSLKIKDGHEVVILITSCSDRAWAERFFFVEIASLGPDCEGLFLDTWKTEGNLSCLYMYFVSLLIVSVC